MIVWAVRALLARAVYGPPGAGVRRHALSVKPSSEDLGKAASAGARLGVRRERLVKHFLDFSLGHAGFLCPHARNSLVSLLVARLGVVDSEHLWLAQRVPTLFLRSDCTLHGVRHRKNLLEGRVHFRIPLRIRIRPRRAFDLLNSNLRLGQLRREHVQNLFHVCHSEAASLMMLLPTMRARLRRINRAEHHDLLSILGTHLLLGQ